MLTVAAIVAIVAVANAVLPSVDRTSGALISASGAVQDRISSQISLINATGQDGDPDAKVWIKNVGSSTITPLERVDVFFGPGSDFQRIPYGGAGCTAPCWEYTFETGTTTWVPTATLFITIHTGTNLAAGTTYYVQIVTPNGISDSKTFTV